MPLSSVLACVIDFFVALPILVVMMIVYGYHVNVYILLIPFYLLLTVITALGVSLWFSAMDVMYRDVGIVIPFITQIWMYITPIAYGSTLISDPKWNFIYNLNPMVGVVNGFRSAFLGVYTEIPLLSMISSTGIALIILIGGVFYFKHMEKQFADLI